jgi:hypothetical protein
VQQQHLTARRHHPIQLRPLSQRAGLRTTAAAAAATVAISDVLYILGKKGKWGKYVKFVGWTQFNTNLTFLKTQSAKAIHICRFYLKKIKSHDFKYFPKNQFN